MVFSFLKRNQQPPLTLLVDVGSASVGAALVEKSITSTPRILATSRETIPFQAERSSEKLLRALGHTLERSLHALEKERKGRHIAEVSCTFSSPWCVVRSRHLEYSAQREFMVTTELQERLIQEDDARLREALKEILPAGDMLIVERKILDIKLNGYSVKNPYGKKAQRVSMDVVVSVSSKKLVLDVQNRIQRMLPVKIFHAGSFAVGALSGVRDMAPHANNIILVDVTGEGTDCSLVVNDTLLQHTTFARGRNSLIREISLKLGVPHEAAMTLLNMFFHDMLEGKKRLDVERALGDAKQDWVMRFKKVLNTFALQGSLPRVVFLSSDADIFNLFQSMIGVAGKESMVQLSVENLDSKFVAPFVRYESGVMKDPFLAIEALLVNKI